MLQNLFRRKMERVRNQAPIPLRFELWNGQHYDVSPAPTVKVVIPRPAALRYFISPNLDKLGEAFVEGHIRVEGPIHEVFRAGAALTEGASNSGTRYRHLTSHSRRRDKNAIEYHYDVSNDFYKLFLDREMVYSCAYYRSDEDSLDTAQVQKLDHVLRKLMLKPGDRFLDIGCGWGGLIIRAAKHYGALATGVTLSKNQASYAQERIRAENLSDRCTVELCDYRDIPGEGVFDKIASIGMFEHVGLKNLPAYFGKIRSLLTCDGSMLNHGITTSDLVSGWSKTPARKFIDRYVFPDGELPHLSLVLKEMHSAGFELLDVESLRAHYARTCHEWASRLESTLDQAIQIAGEKRARIWQIYLAGCAYGFKKEWMNIYQIVACKAGSRQDALPFNLESVYSGL
jgi:cyclopropane-fatty-acyl-phospholipid synthase